MGKPMAVNIAKAGFDLTVCDLREERCQELALLGAKVASSPREVAEHSDIIEIVVVDDDQTEQVVAGEQGLIHGARSGSIVAVHSTILPATVRKIAAWCSAKGVEVIDAPVSGGQQGAQDRQLCYMVGGDAGVLEKCRPVFATSASDIFHLGELGMGATAKMLIQIVVCLNMIAAHECELLCDKTGLDFKMLQKDFARQRGAEFRAGSLAGAVQAAGRFRSRSTTPRRGLLRKSVTRIGTGSRSRGVPTRHRVCPRPHEGYLRTRLKRCGRPRISLRVA